MCVFSLSFRARASKKCFPLASFFAFSFRSVSSKIPVTISATVLEVCGYFKKIYVLRNSFNSLGFTVNCVRARMYVCVCVVQYRSRVSVDSIAIVFLFLRGGGCVFLVVRQLLFFLSINRISLCRFLTCSKLSLVTYCFCISFLSFASTCFWFFILS